MCDNVEATVDVNVNVINVDGSVNANDIANVDVSNVTAIMLMILLM